MRFLILPLVAALSLPAWASDADIVAARDAVRRNDVPALMTAMAGSQNDLLAPYPAYWQLTRDLDNASDADVRAFMTRWPNSVLAERVRASEQELRAERPEGVLPVDMLTASGSGLDPHISPDAALMQVRRVAEARGLSPEAVEKLVRGHVEGPEWGVWGEPKVNVLRLNVALEELNEN